MLHRARRWWTHFVYVCFRVCDWQKPEYSQFEPMADDAITQGGIQGLGSPLYTCD